MAGQEPTPTPTDPQPQDPVPAPPADPTPTPTPAPQPPAEPTGGAKGVPDDTQKMQRVISEAAEAAVKKALEELHPTDPKPTEPTPTPAPTPTPDVDAIRAEHDAQAKSWAIERELLKAGCVDADAAMVHIKADDVKLSDDGKSVSEGLDLEEIKKTYPYLFPVQTQTQTVSTSATPGGGSLSGEAKTIKDGLAMIKEK